MMPWWHENNDELLNVKGKKMRSFLKLFRQNKPRTRISHKKASVVTEALEVRCVPAGTGGTVTAYFDGISLILTGDSKNNSVNVNVTSSGVSITGGGQSPNTTTIKATGKAIPADFEGLKGSILAYLYGGNDTLSVNSDVEGLPVGGIVFVDLGSGNDSAFFSGSADIAGGFSVYGGSGNDNVDIEATNLEVGGSILINLGSGDKTLEQGADVGVSGSGSLTVGGSILLYGGNEAGGDHLHVYAGGGGASIEVTGGIYQYGFGGSDELLVTTDGDGSEISVGGVISLSGGSGDDFIEVNGDPDLLFLNTAEQQTLADTGELTVAGPQSISALGIYTYGEGGNDGIGIVGASTRYDLYISAGSGNDMVGAANVNVGLNLYVYGSSGNDAIGGALLDVAGNAYIYAGSGNDTVVIQQSTFDGFVFAYGESGNDNFVIDSSVESTPSKTFLNGGAGTDLISPSRASLKSVGVNVSSFEGDLTESQVGAIQEAFIDAFFDLED